MYVIGKVRGEMMRKKMMIAITLFISLFISGITVAAEEEEERQIGDEIIYEIIVDRYNVGEYSQDETIDVEDPKSYHGGDFTGIMNRLEDIEEIGVTTMVLSPIMANSDEGFHGYWIEDFTEVEEHFGTFEELERLITESHEREIKVVLEFVTNYISEDHPIAVDPAYSDWILAEQVTGPEWTEGVVQLDQENPEVQEFLMDSATFWLDQTEIDGLQLHAADQSSVEFLNEFTSELKSQYPEMLLLGDVLDAESDIDQIMENTAFDAIDDYDIGKTYSETFSQPDQSPVDIYEAIQDSGDYQSLVMMDDKYSKRFTQRFAENGRNALTTWKLALTMLYTSPGTPQLLQGSEVTMYGGTPEESQRLVPFTSGEQDILEFHDRISSLRDEFEALRLGDYELENATDSFLVYKRTYGDQVMYIAINNGSESAYIDVTDVEEDMMFRGFLEDNVVRANQEGNYRLGIPRESVEVYQLMDDVGYNWALIALLVGVLGTFVVVIIALERKQKLQEKKLNQSKD